MYNTRYTINMPNLVDTYIKTLTEKELIVLQLAKTHLQSSFDITKSIGFKNWLKTQ